MKCILTKAITLRTYHLNLIKNFRTMTTTTESTIDLKRTISDQFESSGEKRNKSTDAESINKSPTNELAAEDSTVNASNKDVQIDWHDYRNFRMKEENVGITEFVSENRPFKCEIKERFSDFIVHEIGSDGQIIELTNQDKPPTENDEDVLLINDEELLELVPNEIRERLEKMDNSEQTTDEIILFDVDNKDKIKRTKIHKFLSRYSTLDSLTEMIDNKKHIKVIKLPKSQSRRSNSKWPKNLPIYLHFSFYQENKGTQDALSDLAKRMNLNFKNIGYAGLKDKRAISTQQCSLYKVFPSKLIEFNKKASNYKFPSATGNYQFRDVPLFLGDAIGNKFQLVLREVQCESESDIVEAMKNAQENGFINYFGIQRFGHSEYPSHRVGIAIIKKEYKEAIDLVLRYRKKDIEPAPYSKSKKTFNECLKIFVENNDAKTAFKEFFWKSTNEGHLLKGLSLYGTNYLQAFAEIPRNNRSFYCHSFQSFIWNQIASFRFRTYGLKLIKGDLAIKRKDLFQAKNGEATGDQECAEQVEEGVKKVRSERVKLNYIREFDDEDVVVVDESNIDDYTIFDVVLPMIGPKVQNPENLVKDEIKRLLDEQGVDEEQLQSVGDLFFMKGRYRRFMAKPIDLKHEIVRYEDNTIRLFETDLDKLNKVEHNVENAGMKTAVKLEFALPSSSYATVLIREISRQNC